MTARVTFGGRLGLGLALVGCWGATALSAQGRPETRDGPTWTLQGIRDGYCVRFLVEPGMAAKELRDGFVLVKASNDKSLHPALRRVLEAQPEFASWTPSALCLYYVDAVDIGRQRITEKRKAQLLGVWTLATVEQGSGQRRDLALDFFTGRGHLARAAEITHVRLHEAESAVSQVAESSDSEYDVKIGKTRVIWKGRAVGDSARRNEPVDESWLVDGTSGKAWTVHLTLRAAWSRDVVGVLSVEGKDALAKALKGSPIRFVGPLYRGGSGELRFSP